MVQKKYKRSSNKKWNKRIQSKHRIRSRKFKKTRKIHKRSRKISSTKKSMKNKRYRGKSYQKGGNDELEKAFQKLQETIREGGYRMESVDEALSEFPPKFKDQISSLKKAYQKIEGFSTSEEEVPLPDSQYNTELHWAASISRKDDQQILRPEELDNNEAMKKILREKAMKSKSGSLFVLMLSPPSRNEFQSTQIAGSGDSDGEGPEPEPEPEPQPEPEIPSPPSGFNQRSYSNIREEPSERQGGEYPRALILAVIVAFIFIILFTES